MQKTETRQCPQHGPLGLRPKERQTPEQLWCGEWWDCEKCHYSVLVPSDELLKQHHESFQRLEREYSQLTTKKAREKYLSGLAPWNSEALINGTNPYRAY